jgi:hypothetical protein
MFVCLYLFLSLNALAQDHLVPDLPYFFSADEYTIALNHSFKKGLHKTVWFNSLVKPSFRPEYMVGIRREEKKETVFSIVANESIWAAVESGVYKGAANSSESSVQISMSLAKRIKIIFSKELMNVHHEKSPGLAIDNTTYHFSMFLKKYGFVSGRLRSFQDNSKMALLVQITEALLTYSKGMIGEEVIESYVSIYENWESNVN